ncbi:glycosyl hydrolase [Kitasatospora sp. GAS1066B]|uniref:glycosyl hydrolase n=1 Tax=Kitasatospora sp. GAS1066B TaxID=3156271 RepID=UPI0035123061
MNRRPPSSRPAAVSHRRSAADPTYHSGPGLRIDLDELDLRLDDLTAASQADADTESKLTLSATELHVLAEQHTAHPHSADLTDSYLVAFDSAAIYGMFPGARQIAAIHIARDLAVGTYRADVAYLPFESLAQHWLIQRGAAPDRFRANEDMVQTPADATTRAIEQRLRDFGHRYRIVDDYTYESSPFTTWIMAEDAHPDDPALPFRIFVQELVEGTDSYTLREGVFPSQDAARDWLDDPSAPLPVAPATPSARSIAARTRTGPVLQGTPRPAPLTPPAATRDPRPPRR